MSSYRHIELTDVDSTNTRAVELAMNGDIGDVWITATSQTMGKARRGREWISKTGNLYASLLLIDLVAQRNVISLPLVASIALYDAVANLIGTTDSLSIKWPNDLLLSSKKFSGILLEKGEDSHARPWTVLGFGVNCAHYPTDTDYPATSLTNEGYDISPKVLFNSLSTSMSSTLERWDYGNGISTIREDWLSRCQGLGSTIKVRLSNETLTGIFEDLDSTGRLILSTPTDKHHISAGDIFFE